MKKSIKKKKKLYPPLLKEKRSKNNRINIESKGLIRKEIELEDYYIEDLPEDRQGDLCDYEKEPIEKVQIYGTDCEHILPILTDAQGRLKISSNIIIPPISYDEKVYENIITSNNYVYTPSIDVSQYTATSFIVVNHSITNDATIQLQQSPDNSMFKIDAPEMTVSPNAFEILTSTRFIRYLRVAYRSTNPNQPAKIDIYFQGQGYKTNS